MRRDSSTTSLGGSPSSASSDGRRCCDYKKLNLLAFAGTLVYIGYLLGCMENGGGGGVGVGGNSASDAKVAAFAAFGMSPAAGEGSGIDDRGSNGGGSLRASAPSTTTTSADGGGSSDERGRGKEDDEEEGEDSSPAYAKGPVIYGDMGPVTSINLLGERHSGTNWITDHLIDCFGDQIPVETDFTRFKHWFQFDDATIRNDSALVIAMFRDPYDWVEAMHERPHHAHDHIDLDWHTFVTKPWIGPRGPADRVKMDKAKAEGFKIEKWGCLAGYNFDEVIPCSAEDSITIDGYSKYMYELRHDRSHRAYGSVIELRTAKILNFLQVPKFAGVKAFFPERYEALNLRGTADFLKQVEEVTGLKAKCEPFEGTGVVKHKDIDPEFIEWMNRYHDWNAEAMIGYVKRDPPPGDKKTVLQVHH